ncbi:10036_t:CDS:2 [Ambispora gerdemannii]|uniref:10036_t:CDS:1 n=1 Tax=Ambispora gerdemannii TaxID=144530 RepID=A0A9N9CXK7_9GLOM|nr:10036_t:CDS:2 [Ambispora gerdemannii]
MCVILLQSPSFRKFIHECIPGFAILSINTAKQLIDDTYIWSKDQLQGLINSSATTINLTTDLWTAKSKLGYLGITATWLDSNYEFHEVLLSCHHLPYPHTAVRLLGHTYVKRIPCAAHTPQLSIQEGLKQCQGIHQRIKNLQLFFHSPKRAQELHEAQLEIATNEPDDQEIIYMNEEQSSLEILLDVRTRWNNTYLAWKRLLKLEDAIRYLEVKFRTSRLQAIRNEEITHHMSGAKYLIINLVYPYMYILTQQFAPKENESMDTYLDLLYDQIEEEAPNHISDEDLVNVEDTLTSTRQISANNNEDNNATTDEDSDNFSSIQSYNLGHILTRSHSRDRRYGRNHGHSRGRSQNHNQHNYRNQRESNQTSNPNDVNQTRTLQPTNINEILPNVKAAIYISMNKSWQIPSCEAMLVTILDPRLKSL